MKLRFLTLFPAFLFAFLFQVQISQSQENLFAKIKAPSPSWGLKITDPTSATLAVTGKEKTININFKSFPGVSSTASSFMEGVKVEMLKYPDVSAAGSTVSPVSSTTIGTKEFACFEIKRANTVNQKLCATKTDPSTVFYVFYTSVGADYTAHMPEFNSVLMNLAM